MDHQMQQLFGFGLKSKRLLFGGSHGVVWLLVLFFDCRLDGGNCWEFKASEGRHPLLICW
jgi:hypothetical protein